MYPSSEFVNEFKSVDMQVGDYDFCCKPLKDKKIIYIYVRPGAPMPKAFEGPGWPCQKLDLYLQGRHASLSD